MNDLLIDVLDDSEQPDEPNPELKASEAEYEGVGAIESVSEGEILIVSDSEENVTEVSADDESVASDTPSTEGEGDVLTRDAHS